jgi:hypothetical protein
VNGMKRANLIGKVVQIFPVLSYNKNGKEGKVGKLLLADSSSNAKVVLWDISHISLLESGKIKEGDVLEILNGNIRNGEIHLSSFSDIKLSKEKMENVVEKRTFSRKKLNEVKAGDSVEVRAFIVQSFEPRYFEVCPECGKKVIDDQCLAHGKVQPSRRALLNLVLDDGSESVRAVLFMDQISKLGLSEEEIFSLEKFAEKKMSLLGEEKIFSGNMRTNSLYNTTEFSVNNIEDLNTGSLLQELQVKS